MSFNSLEFVFFFPLVVTVYFLLPHRFRWFWLLATSCCFYMFFVPVYILVLFTAIAIDYAAAIFIEKSKGTRRQAFLLLSIVSTCLILFIFKYFNFFNWNLIVLAHFLHWNYGIKNLSLVLPIGLSFHTFQSLSYVIDVYKGNQKAERHFGYYALYVMFFPQLVAGPIERAGRLLPQFFQHHAFDYERIKRGLLLMSWGFFKKVVIADRLAILVNNVYDRPLDYAGLALFLATYFFAFQIYCDFSGYSDIAIGTAEVMGIKLRNNFHCPYLSQSIAEFWRRWHISLSTWFKDYVYLPLGGNRVVRTKRYFNIFGVFVLSGFWHGADWRFIIWGFLHGFYYVFGDISHHIRIRFVSFIGLNRIPVIYKCVKVLTIFHLVCFGWIFFRANSIEDAFYIVTHLFYDWQWRLSGYGMGLGIPQTIFSMFLIGVLLLANYFKEKVSVRFWIMSQPLIFRWSTYLGLILVIYVFGYYQSNSDFIYFQF